MVRTLWNSSLQQSTSLKCVPKVPIGLNIRVTSHELVVSLAELFIALMCLRSGATAEDHNAKENADRKSVV